jgi:hypothetical protein
MVEESKQRSAAWGLGQPDDRSTRAAGSARLVREAPRVSALRRADHNSADEPSKKNSKKFSGERVDVGAESSYFGPRQLPGRHLWSHD